jgi:hypothetical protein
MATARGSNLLSDAAEKQVLLALTGPYKRVAGLTGRYEDIPIPVPSTTENRRSDSRSASDTVRRPADAGRVTLGLGGSGVLDGAAVSTTSFKEYKHMMEMHVPPRLGAHPLAL